MISLIVAAAAMSAPSPPCPPSRLPFATVCARMTPQTYGAEAQRTLSHYDADKNGLDAGDIELHRLREQAEERAHSLREILRYDLDGDLKLDAREIEHAAPEEFYALSGERSSRADQKMRRIFLTYDADRDEIIEREEIFAAPLPQHALGILEGLRAMLALDPDKDGRVGAHELSQLSDAAFNGIDQDGDGIVSDIERDNEAKYASELRTGWPRYTPSQLCALPQVPSNATLIVYSSRDGAPSGQPGHGSTAVNIEEGSEPLYLVLTSYEPITWRISGDTARIVQLVLSQEREGGQSLAVGLAPEKIVAFKENCIGSSDGGTRELPYLVNRVWRFTGRKPDVAKAVRTGIALSLPSAEVETPVVESKERAKWTPVDLCAEAASPSVPPDLLAAGAQGVYTFVTQGASEAQLSEFLRKVGEARFSLFPMTISLDGFDTLVVTGSASIRSPAEAERQFRSACALGNGSAIYLAAARHNPAAADGPARVQ